MKQFVCWFAAIFTEADGNGGKASFSRVFGAALLILLYRMIWLQKPIPEQAMTLFWALIGYQFASKALGSMSPSVLDIAKSFLVKAGAKVEEPKS